MYQPRQPGVGVHIWDSSTWEAKEGGLSRI